MKKVYVETFGCQMNVHDTEKALSSLKQANYHVAATAQEADLVLLNTCMVREKAARKVFSRIQQIKSTLQSSITDNPLPTFGVMGCVAQAMADRMFEISKDVRLVIGTQAIASLPQMVAQLEQGYTRAINVKLSKDADFFDMPAGDRQTAHVAYVSIMEGCNKFCSYCIVPFTRGRERSRTADSIISEIIDLQRRGCQEVQLLGQNVNSYGLTERRHPVENGKLQDRNSPFAALLERIACETDIPRIKFTTSYPKDFCEKIVSVMERHLKLCEWIHLPAQSGSDRILRAMRRGYSREEYLDKIKMIRSSSRDFSITGDIIVGFPGETEADFEDTLSLVSEVEYDGLYIFKYSPRPQTPSAKYSYDLSDEVVSDRFLKIQELQSRIQKLRYERHLGEIHKVLVEGKSARSSDFLMGHSTCNKVVNFAKGDVALGEIVPVKIISTSPNSLIGQLVD